MYRYLFKTILDFILASILLIIISPLFLGVFISLLVVNNFTVFFIQKRPGRLEKTFSIIKFKTMNDKRDSFGNLLPDSERITKIGSFIRKTSLDEIPQLINVLKGDMSLVGPRPLLPEYISLYNDFQKRRHEVKPGITGWAQVNGRNALSWEEKFKLDVWYVDNQSFWLDAKILIMTIKKVVKKEGISHRGSVTMEKFTGTSK